MIMPGVQKPHCSAWQSVNACCTGCSLSPLAMPSIVTMLRAVGLRRQHGAGLHGAAVDMHRAAAALAGIAADVGAGEAEMVAQQIDQQRAVFDLARVAACR